MAAKFYNLIDNNHMKRYIVFVMLLFSLDSLAQQLDVGWDYPIKPGTNEWKNLKSYEEQLNSYNIPSEIIKKISTEELVKTCLAYPEWRMINAYSDRQAGLANVIGLFNGFHELLVRHDAAKELIKVYVKMDPLVIDRNWTSLQKGTYSFQFTCIEMLLSHGVIVRQLDETNIRVLLNEAISKYKSKKQMEDMCSLWYLSPTAGLCLSILEKDGLLIKSNSDLQLFQQTFMTEDIEILERIIEESEKRIKL
jgi:hypothetical protein